MDENTDDNEKYSKWKVELIRLSYFSDQIENSDADKWWETIISDPPEQKVTLPKQNLYQLKSAYSNGTLVLTTQFNRADWIYTPTEQELYLGTSDEAMKSFSELISRWFEISPQMKRLALGLILQMPVESKKDGYELLSKYLPNIKIDAENSTDFFYQINQPRKTTTGVSDLSINRLMKWSVMHKKKVAITSNKVDFADHGNYSVRLELDMNTFSTFSGIFHRENISEIYSELNKLAKEIMISGDKP